MLILSSACWQRQSTNAGASGKACGRCNILVNTFKMVNYNKYFGYFNLKYFLTILFLPRRSWKTRRRPKNPRSQSGWSTSNAVCPEPAVKSWSKGNSSFVFLDCWHKRRRLASLLFAWKLQVCTRLTFRVTVKTRTVNTIVPYDQFPKTWITKK